METPLLTDEDSNKTNLVTVTLESLFAVPEGWNNPTQSYAYTVSLPLPFNDDVIQFQRILCEITNYKTLFKKSRKITLSFS